MQLYVSNGFNRKIAPCLDDPDAKILKRAFIRSFPCKQLLGTVCTDLGNAQYYKSPVSVVEN